jgi:hypothetical protein
MICPAVSHKIIRQPHAFLFKLQQELIANNLVFGLIEFQNINQLAFGHSALNLILNI